jgi:hypothetical protein
MQSFMRDMPKIHSPFVREERNGGYFVVDEVNTDDNGNSYDWVFNDPRTMAIEKIDGTNVSVLIQNGQIVQVMNRKNRVPAFHGDRRITDAIRNSVDRGYVETLTDGQHFGEVVGPKVQGNPYDLNEHIWIPFSSYSRRKLQYESWGKYPKTFDAIESWFENGLIPLFYSTFHGTSFQEAHENNAYVEGIMFTHPKPSDIDTLPYAKLRYDMFEGVSQYG